MTKKICRFLISGSDTTEDGRNAERYGKIEAGKWDISQMCRGNRAFEEVTKWRLQGNTSSGNPKKRIPLFMMNFFFFFLPLMEKMNLKLWYSAMGFLSIKWWKTCIYLWICTGSPMTFLKNSLMLLICMVARSDIWWSVLVKNEDVQLSKQVIY